MTAQTSAAAVETWPETDADTLARRMGWLAWWLEKEHWTAYETACLLLGVLPNAQRWKAYEAACLSGVLPSGESARGFGEVLPGALPWPGQRERWNLHMSEAITRLTERLGTVAGLGFLRPMQVLAKVRALDGELAPPWLPFAEEDSACSAAMAERPPKPKKLEASAKASKAAGVKWKHDDKHILLLPEGAGRMLFEKMKNAGFIGPRFRIGKENRPNAAAIGEAIYEHLAKHFPKDHPEKYTVTAHVREWLKKG